MRKTTGSNLPLEVTLLCKNVSRKCVEPYSHRNCPRKFTQAQLLTLSVLKACLKTTYGGVGELVEVSDELNKRIELASFQHNSTLRRFADRTSVQDIVDGMLLGLAQRLAARKSRD